MIDIKKLNDGDINRKALYQAFMGSVFETCRIVKWNDDYVFVDFGDNGFLEAVSYESLTLNEIRNENK